MSYLERALRYRRVHGTRKLFTEGLARVRARLASYLRRAAPGHDPAQPALGGHWVSATDLVRARFAHNSPLRTYTVPPGAARVSLVTDSINAGSLYGGVGTSILLATQIAQSRGARLRIVTRTERGHPSNLASLFTTYGIAPRDEVEFAYSPFDQTNYEIDRLDGELFITTSWWTTASALATVPHADILYLLQEDERMFYPHGDEHLRCSRVLETADIRYAINSRLLFDHLVSSGLPHIATQGQWFEPAFPPSVFHRRSTDASAKKSLLFYARPHNQRNLFYFGLEVLEAAIQRGIVDPHEWDFIFVGKDIPPVRLAEGSVLPTVHENLKWSDYAALVGRVDLGLCLMYTPHPSYPPLDLAASGAVVVTNRFGGKQDLANYSANIVTGDARLEPMLAALAEGVRLAGAAEERARNHAANRLGTDWTAALAPVVARYGSAAR